MKELLKEYNKLYKKGFITHNVMSEIIGVNPSTFCRWRTEKTKTITFCNLVSFTRAIELMKNKEDINIVNVYEFKNGSYKLKN